MNRDLLDLACLYLAAGIYLCNLLYAYLTS